MDQAEKNGNIQEDMRDEERPQKTNDVLSFFCLCKIHNDFVKNYRVRIERLFISSFIRSEVFRIIEIEIRRTPVYIQKKTNISSDIAQKEEK